MSDPPREPALPLLGCQPIHLTHIQYPNAIPITQRQARQASPLGCHALLQLPEIAQRQLGAVDDGKGDHHASHRHPGSPGCKFETKDAAANEQSRQRTDDVVKERAGHFQAEAQPVLSKDLQVGAKKLLIQPTEQRDGAADNRIVPTATACLLRHNAPLHDLCLPHHIPKPTHWQVWLPTRVGRAQAHAAAAAVSQANHGLPSWHE